MEHRAWRRSEGGPASMQAKSVRRPGGNVDYGKSSKSFVGAVGYVYWTISESLDLFRCLRRQRPRHGTARPQHEHSRLLLQRNGRRSATDDRAGRSVLLCIRCAQRRRCGDDCRDSMTRTRWTKMGRSKARSTDYTSSVRPYTATRIGPNRNVVPYNESYLITLAQPRSEHDKYKPMTVVESRRSVSMKGTYWGYMRLGQAQFDLYCRWQRQGRVWSKLGEKDGKGTNLR